MKLLLVSSFPPNPQGEANYAGKFVRTLQERDPGLECYVVAQVLEEESGPDGAPNVIRVMRRSGWRRHFNALRIIAAVLRLRPDVVHLQSPVIPEYGGLFGEPMLPALALLRLFGVRTVISLHSTWTDDDLINLCREKGLGRVMTRLFVSYYKFVIRTFSQLSHGFQIVTAGEQSPAAERCRAEYRMSAVKVQNEPHPCNPLGCSPETQALAKSKVNFPGKRVVAAFGFMREDKGVHLLLDAMNAILSAHPDTALVIAGRAQRPSDQAYVERIRRLCDTSVDPSRVLFLDRYLSDEEMASLFDAADVFVVPYLRVLGPSGPAHHSIGRYKPLIVSEIGHNLGLRGTCMTVPPGDAMALQRALFTMLGSPATTGQWSALSRAYAESHTWHGLAESYLRYYRDLLRSPRSAQFRFVPDIASGI
jgi:glycosyltransferase involved in cell wall biosynthesis